MEVTRFTKHQVWEGVLPSYLALRTAGKMDGVGERKHLAGIMQHRDPMRAALPMLGLYLCYQLLTLQWEVPTMDTWLEKMHRRPLICLQSGKGAHVTDYNDRLKEELRLVGARHADFTLHGIRNQLNGEAHEDPSMRIDSIMNGLGHSTGSHFEHYKGCLDSSFILMCAGYRGTSPEMQAAHDVALCALLNEHPQDAREVVDVLYRHWRGELLALEETAANAQAQEVRDKKGDGPGHRMVEFLHWLRYCVLSWIVSSAARPRDRMGLIDADRDVKRTLMAPAFTAHLQPLLKTSVYARVAALVRAKEDLELRAGPLAQRTASEARLAMQANASEARLAQQVAAIPDCVAARVDPQLRGLELDLDDERERRLDVEYLQTLDEHERLEYTRGDDDDEQRRLRKARLAHERRKADARARVAASTSMVGMGIVKTRAVPPPPTAALAPMAAGPSSSSSASSLPTALVTTTSPPLSPPAITDDATKNVDAAPAAIVPSSTPDVGTEEWKNLPDETRHADVRAILDSVGLHSLHLSGVPGMMRQYLLRIAPLERLPAKRGQGWRDTRFAGQPNMQAGSNLLTREYEPILCRVLELHDEGGTLWDAAAALEEERVAQQGGNKWERLLATPAVQRLAKDREARKPLLARLQDADFATEAMATAKQKAAPMVTLSTSDDEEDNEGGDGLVFLRDEGATTRYLALDPALSCGWAWFRIDDDSRVLSIEVGVFEVTSKESDGKRCLDLQAQLRAFLRARPVPDHVFIEPFFGHGHEKDALSYKLRAALEMELAAHDVAHTDIKPQSWKKAVGVATSTAGKAEIKACLERKLMGVAFPREVFVGTRWLKFRHDASDATGIGLCGIHRLHPLYTFADSFCVAAPGRPRPRVGKALSPDEEEAVEEAEPLAEEAATPAPAKVLHDPMACTLSAGCSKGVNHSGICNVTVAGSREGRGRKRAWDEEES